MYKYLVLLDSPVPAMQFLFNPKGGSKTQQTNTVMAALATWSFLDILSDGKRGEKEGKNDNCCSIVLIISFRCCLAQPGHPLCTTTRGILLRAPSNPAGHLVQPIFLHAPRIRRLESCTAD